MLCEVMRGRGFARMDGYDGRYMELAFMDMEDSEGIASSLNIAWN